MAIGLLAAVAAAPPATASEGGSASAAGVNASAATVNLSVSTTGLLGLLQPVADLLSAPLLTGANLDVVQAGAPPPPTGGLIDQAVSATLPGVLSTGLVTAQTSRSHPAISSNASIAGSAVTLLGLPLVTTGVIQSTTQMPVAGAGSASTSVANLSVLGTTPALAPNASVTVNAPLNTDQVVGLIPGLQGLLDPIEALGLLNTEASGNVSVTVGRTQSVQTNQASATGLTVSASLNINLHLELLNAIPLLPPVATITAGTNSNVLDIKLAESSTIRPTSATGDDNGGDDNGGDDNGGDDNGGDDNGGDDNGGDDNGGGNGNGTIPSGPLPGLPDSLAGDDRIETALAIARAEFRPVGSGDDSLLPAGAAVLASAYSYADGTVAGPLAFAHDAPLLLTPADRLDDRVAQGLVDLIPTGHTVYLVGGEAALSAEVAQAVAALGYEVVRFDGINRYHTAVLVASDGLADPDVLYAATGLDFPDALAAGVIAARLDGAVLLTRGAEIPNELASYLDSRGEVDLTVVGGPADQAFPEIDGITGIDRYATATLLADTLPPTNGLVGLATGEDFADALAGTAYVARRDGVMLLTRTAFLTPVTATYLFQNTDIDTVQTFGGPLAISHAVRLAVSAIVG